MNEQSQACSNKSETFKSQQNLRTVEESLKDVFMLNVKSEGGVTQISKSGHKDNLIKVPEHRSECCAQMCLQNSFFKMCLADNLQEATDCKGLRICAVDFRVHVKTMHQSK